MSLHCSENFFTKLLNFILQSVTKLRLTNIWGILGALHLFMTSFTIFQYDFFETLGSFSLLLKFLKYDFLAYSTAFLHSP